MKHYEFKRFIGIDNGLSGGIACIVDGKINALQVMPVVSDGKRNRVDSESLLRLMSGIVHSYSNKDTPMRHVRSFTIYESPAGSKSVKAAVSMADSFARVETILTTWKYPCLPITSRKWQKMFWSVPKMAKGQKFDTKAAALRVAKQLWPEQNWLASSRCRKPHDGLVDAALIAEFCRRTYS